MSCTCSYIKQTDPFSSVGEPFDKMVFSFQSEVADIMVQLIDKTLICIAVRYISLISIVVPKFFLFGRIACNNQSAMSAA